MSIILDVKYKCEKCGHEEKGQVRGSNDEYKMNCPKCGTLCKALFTTDDSDEY